MNGQDDATTFVALAVFIAVGTLFSLSMLLSIVGMIHVAMSGGRVVGMTRAVTALVLSFVGPGLLLPLILLTSPMRSQDSSGRIRIGPFEKIFDRTSGKLGPLLNSLEGDASNAPTTVEFVTKSTITGETETGAYRAIAERLKDRGFDVDADSFELRFDGFAVRLGSAGDAPPSTANLLKAAREVVEEMVADDSIPKDSVAIQAVREHAR